MRGSNRSVIPNRADGGGPRDWTIFIQSTLPPPRAWARSLAYARDDVRARAAIPLGAAGDQPHFPEKFADRIA
ncbi:MAG: hypothetical protein DME47_01290 [Verrucomicrobia bacterium]|nr:MAG: hypothetical protein DME47_01290 [Verrucomicrobiota bacterium]